MRWEQYTKAKEEMFERTSIDEAPWYIVEGNDKRRERLNCISHILSKVPFSETPHENVELPKDFLTRIMKDKPCQKNFMCPSDFKAMHGKANLLFYQSYVITAQILQHGQLPSNPQKGQ